MQPTPLAQTQVSARDVGSSSFVSYVTDGLTSPTGITLAVCAIVLGALSLLGHKPSQGKIARGKFGGERERRHAREKAIAQIAARKHNEVALWIGDPAKSRTIRERGRTFYYCPPDPKTFYIPDAQRSVLICGGPNSGKSFSAVEPLVRSAIRQHFPVLLYDFKYPRQTARLAGMAEAHGYRVSLFAPGFAESEVCNPLDFLRDATDAETARQLAEVLNANFKRLTGSATGGGDNPFFDNAGIQLTEAILMLAKSSPYPDIMTCTCLLQLDDLVNRLTQADLNYWIRTSFGQLMATARSPETVASIVSTAFINFNRFMKPGLLRSFVGETTLPLDLEDRQMVVFGMDRQRRDVVGPLVAAIMHLIVERNVSRQRRTPLVVSLDELTTFYLPRLGHWLNESREDGFVGILGFQNLAQLEKMYGKDGSRIIVAGTGTKAIFNPQEYEAAKVFSDYLGDEDLMLKQKSRGSSGGKGSSNTSDQDRTRKLVDPNQFLTQPTGTAVIVTPGLSNAKRASLPIQQRIRISKRELKQVERSQQRFGETIARVRQREEQESVSELDLQIRYDAAEALLPREDEGASPPMGMPSKPMGMPTKMGGDVAEALMSPGRETEFWEGD